MNPERWQRIDQVFQAALERPAEARASFLVEACEGDEELRGSVEALLASDAHTWQLLDTPAFEAALGLLSDDRPEFGEGDRIGRYRVIRQLGSGGMGDVYLAEDPELGRQIALKILPAAIAGSAGWLERFRREARAVSSLNHPNIVTIHEVGDFDGRPFFVSEFIDGETLRQRLERGRPTAREIVDIAVQAAGALAAAHRAGIIHRDVKPDNIMLRPDGYVKVLDFGLAKLVAHDDAPAARGAGGGISPDASSALVMGTVRYMSPEQADGLVVDARSDVFSFGVVLYEMVTGRPAFTGATPAAILNDIRMQQPVPPAACAPGVPAELERVILGCLAKDTCERHQSIEQVLAALTALRHELQHAEDRAGPRLVRWLARHPRRAALAALAVAAAGILAVATWRRLSERPREPFSRIEISRVLDTERARMAAISPDGRYICYAGPGADSPQESLHLRSLDRNTTSLLVPAADVVYYGVSFSPEGSFVYFSREQKGRWALSRVPVKGGAATEILEGIRSPVAFSPDGGRIACVKVSEQEVALVVSNADGTRARTLRSYARTTPPGPSFGIGGPAWSPDGRAILSSYMGPWSKDRRWNVMETRADDGTERLLGTWRWTSVGQIAALPRSAGMIMLAGESAAYGQLWHVPYAAGEPRQITNALERYDSLSATRDGLMLAASRVERLATLWMAPGRGATDPRPIAAAPGHDLTQVAWTPDGRILFPSAASGHREIWLMEADGTNQRQLSADRGRSGMPAASPDGRYVVYCSDRDGENGLWRMNADGRDPVRLNRSDPAGCLDPQVSPDGRWVIFAGFVSGPAAMRKVPIDGGDSVPIAPTLSMYGGVSPDGRWVACLIRAAATSRPVLAVVPFAGGAPVRTFDAVPTNPVRWTSDGLALVYVAARAGVSNIWRQPLAGGQPAQVTRFTSDTISGFDWSREDRLATVRVSLSREIVLITDRGR